MKPDTTTAAANDPTMGLEAAAAFLHLGLDSMKKLVANGDVPAVQLNQKHTVMLREDLVGYLREEGRRQAEARRAARRKVVPHAATAKRHAARQARAPLPDLTRYELTTGDQPASTPAGSRSAPASPSSDAP